MYIYWVEIIAIALLGIIIFYNGTNTHKKKIFIFSSANILFWVMAFRNQSVGTDTQLYCTVFKNIANASNVFKASDASILYALYNKIISIVFGNNSQNIIFGNSFVIIALFSIFAYKNSKNIVMTFLYFLLFYHYFQAFNISRQYISILLVANSLYFIEKKNVIGFLVLNILAILIHNTAIIFLPAGFILLYVDLDLKKIWKMSIIATIFLALYEKIINLFLKVFPRYSMYFKGSKLFYNAGGGQRIFVTILYFIIVFLAIILIREKENGKEECIRKEKKMWYDMIFLIILAILCGILSLKFVLLNRIELYFSIFIVIFIPLFIEKIPKQKYTIYSFSFIILSFLTYAYFIKNIAGVVPYTTFF